MVLRRAFTRFGVASMLWQERDRILPWARQAVVSAGDARRGGVGDAQAGLRAMWALRRALGSDADGLRARVTDGAATLEGTAPDERTVHEAVRTLEKLSFIRSAAADDVRVPRRLLGRQRMGRRGGRR